MLGRVLLYQPDEALADLRRVLARSCYGSILSTNGPSDKLGSVQLRNDPRLAPFGETRRGDHERATGEQNSLYHSSLGQMRAALLRRRRRLIRFFSRSKGAQDVGHAKVPFVTLVLLDRLRVIHRQRHRERPRPHPR